jgi:hypothetical protein
VVVLPELRLGFNSQFQPPGLCPPSTELSSQRLPTRAGPLAAAEWLCLFVVSPESS